LVVPVSVVFLYRCPFVFAVDPTQIGTRAVPSCNWYPCRRQPDTCS